MAGAMRPQLGAAGSNITGSEFDAVTLVLRQASSNTGTCQRAASARSASR